MAAHTKGANITEFDQHYERASPTAAAALGLPVLAGSVGLVLAWRRRGSRASAACEAAAALRRSRR